MAQSYPDSYYAATRNAVPAFEQLEGRHRVDVGIVGGGFTGIATALSLTEKGYRVAVVEANRVGWGASGRNGGQFTEALSGEKSFYKALGDSTAREFLRMLRKTGNEVIQDRVRRYGIDCDLKNGHLMAAFKPRQLAELQAEYDRLVEDGYGDTAELVDRAGVAGLLGTDVYDGGLLTRHNGHLHPLNLCLGEADAARNQGALIFEESPVEDIRGDDQPEIVTAKGVVQADKVMLAGNAYHHLERKKLSGMIFPATSHIVVTEPLSRSLIDEINPQDLAVYDCRHVLDYYRMTADGRLLFGAGCNYSGRDPADIDRVMRPRVTRIYPQLEGVRIDYRWSGKIGIVLNRVPQLGRTSKNVYYAQGYSGHGICLTHVVGEIMADAIDGKTDRYDVFAGIPHQRIPLGDWFGSQMVALGMMYYRMRDLM